MSDGPPAKGARNLPMDTVEGQEEEIHEMSILNHSDATGRDHPAKGVIATMIAEETVVDLGTGGIEKGIELRNGFERGP